MTELDRTQQRIIGVLIEKELSVPDSYPMTENALLAGCNQKSNRDPEMGLEPFEVHGALVALMTQDWVKTSTSMGSRTTRYAHRLSSQFAVDARETAVICELLVRGPQAPGALKPRVARLGFAASPAEIEAVLQAMASKAVPMVERLPRRPRERDCRWRHLLGAMDVVHQGEGESGAASGGDSSDRMVGGSTRMPASTGTRASTGTPAATGTPASTGSWSSTDPSEDSEGSGLELRVEALELAVEELRDELRRLTGG